MAELKDLDIKKVGNTIQLVGAIYEGEGQTYLCLFPEEGHPDSVLTSLSMSLKDWGTFLRQTDLMETEVLARAKNGSITKAILRKCQRQIAQHVSWAVYRRDRFICRYCGADSVPLTVDHLVLWEDGGPSIEDNLVTCCRKCNRTRGNTPYAEWLNSEYYHKVSENLSDAVREWNVELVDTLSRIPRMLHKPSR